MDCLLDDPRFDARKSTGVSRVALRAEPGRTSFAKIACIGLFSLASIPMLLVSIYPFSLQPVPSLRGLTALQIALRFADGAVSSKISSHPRVFLCNVSLLFRLHLLSITALCVFSV